MFGEGAIPAPALVRRSVNRRGSVVLQVVVCGRALRRVVEPDAGRRVRPFHGYIGAVQRFLRRMTVLLFCSGLALSAAAVVGLGEAARSAVAAAEARTGALARDLADRVRDGVAERRLLDEVAAEHRFAAADGVLRVPAEVGWLRTPPTDAPWPWHTVLAEARRAALDGDPAAARRRIERALSAEEPQPALLPAAAWYAHRADDREAAAAHLALARADCAALTPGGLASVVLLAARLSGELVPEAVRWWGRVPEELASGVVAELDRAGVDAGGLADVTRRVERLRATLVAADGARARWQAAVAPLVAPVEAGVLVFHPEAGGPGVGDGAVLSAEQLIAALAARGVVASGAGALVGVGAGGAPGPGDVVAVDGVLAVRPPASPPLSLWQRPAVVYAVLGLLAACFCCGLFWTLRALRRERDAVGARAEFLTSVTHELRTPLASLRLLAEMLHDGRADAAQRAEYTALLAGETARLGALIDNVLDLRRIERGERRYDRRRLPLAQLVRDSVALHAPVAERGGVRLAVEVEPAARRVEVEADAGALRQLLLGLFDNAVKYAAAGGRVAVRVVSTGGTVEVAVRDFGAGVVPAQREALFARFARGAAHAESNVPGVGLGLYLGRAIARAHGGDLVCAAPIDGGAGAVFVLTLPIAGAAGDTAALS